MVPSVPGADQWVTTYLIPAIAGLGGGALSRLIPRLVMRKLEHRDERHQWYSEVHGITTQLIEFIQDDDFYEDGDVSGEVEQQFETFQEKFNPPRTDADYTVKREGSLIIETYQDAIDADPSEDREQELADRLSQLLTHIERVSGIDSAQTPSWRSVF